MVNMVGWSAGTVIVLDNEIKDILFHKGRMLLLDEAVIAADKAIGKFMVTAQSCEGHEPVPGVPMFRGVDVAEVGFQLIGIVLAKNTNFSEMLSAKKFVLRQVVGMKFSGPIRPGDKLTVEMAPCFKVYEAGSGSLWIESGVISAKVSNKRKCTVTSVVVTAFYPKNFLA